MPIDSDHLVSVNIKPKAASGEAASSAATEDRVFISEHHTSHHGHSHSHGHIHARPEGLYYQHFHSFYSLIIPFHSLRIIVKHELLSEPLINFFFKYYKIVFIISIFIHFIRL